MSNDGKKFIFEKYVTKNVFLKYYVSNSTAVNM